MGNVIPFARRPEPVTFAPGVVPFDASNPAHVRAWNSLFAFGKAEQARRNEPQEGR